MPARYVSLFVDDLRDTEYFHRCFGYSYGPATNWVVARTYQEAIDALDNPDYLFDVISLDHDLGEDNTGYDVLCRIEEKLDSGSIVLSNGVFVHSDNASGNKKMRGAIARMYERNEMEHPLYRY